MNDVASMSIVTSAKTGVTRRVEGGVFGCSVLSSQSFYKSKAVSKVKVYCVGQVWRYTLIIPEPRKVKRGDQEFKVIFSHKARLRPSWATRDPFLT